MRYDRDKTLKKFINMNQFMLCHVRGKQTTLKFLMV